MAEVCGTNARSDVTSVIQPVSQVPTNMEISGTPLNADDYSKLARSWIPRELADQALIRRVASHEGGRLIGRNGSGDWSGLVFHYAWPGDDYARAHRVRLDRPELELRPDGKVKEKGKYLAAPGRGSMLYFVPGTPAAWLEDTALPIAITEGEKKGIALFRLACENSDAPRFVAVALPGVWNWRGTVGKEAGPDGSRLSVKGPIPDLARVHWKARKVYIVFDSNVHANYSVRSARSSLARELRKRGAHVFFVNVPELEGVNGIDDWLALRGPEEVLNAFDNASTSELAQVPQGFELDASGLHKIRDGGERTFLCSRLEVVARARNKDQEDWSKQLRWWDKDECEHYWVMPMELLAGEKNELLKRLLRGGLHINTRQPKAADDIADYLNRSAPLDDVRCVQSVGWHDSAYVLPDESFGPEGGETIMLYDETPSAHRIRVSGSVEDWREHVGRRCVGNSRLVFAASVAFAGPLLRPLSELGGGFHLRGGSSLGKTTALYVAGSVWGGGGDKGFIRSWRATGAGIESISPLHNDGFLCLDDLGQVLAQDAGRVAYQLANGQTTQRANRRGGARASEDFLLIFLSTGEISLAQHVRESGQQVRGGQEIRMCDVPADAGKGFGLFEKLNGAATPAEMATELRTAALRFYGAPIRSFLPALIGSEWQARVEQCRNTFRASVRELYGDVSSETSRAIARFSIVAAAGELASEIGTTGWPAGEATGATLVCFSAWFREKGSAGPMDEAAAFHQVVELLERHGGSRFQENKETVRDRLGFIGIHKASGEKEFWILGEQFEREFCRNFDSKVVAAELKRRGFLRTDSEGNNRFKVKANIPAMGNARPRVYAIPMRILAAEDNT
jgi:uncharacterized protein (DUF927 family)